MKKNKSEIRKAFSEKYGYKLPRGRMQLSDHGAGEKSIQIFSKGVLKADVTVRGIF